MWSFMGSQGRTRSAVIPAAIAFLAYLPALTFDLVWDDTLFLRDLPLYRGQTPWLEQVLQPFVLSPSYFRPLGLAGFIAELRLLGLSPWVFHLTNVLLHSANTLLVSLLAAALAAESGKSPDLRYPQAVGLAAGLVYALHPALVEGVAFVSSRFDLMVTCCLLLLLLLDLRLPPSLVRLPVLGGAFFLAALSKEMAVALVAVLPFWYLARKQDSRRPGSAWRSRPGLLRSALLTATGCLLGGLAYLALRFHALGALLPATAEGSIHVGGPLQHLLLAGRSLATYARLMLWPFGGQAPIHFARLPVPLDELWAWLALGGCGLLGAGLVWLIRVQPRSGWLATAALFALAPVSHLMPLALSGGAYVAERFLVFPLALLVPAVVLAFPAKAVAGEPVPAGSPRRGEVSVFSLLLLVWLLGCLPALERTLFRWRGDAPLWTWAMAMAPQSAVPATNLALHHIEAGRLTAGLALGEYAVTLDPRDANARNNVGLALIQLGRSGEAEAAFERAVERSSATALYWSNLAGALREQGKLEAAERILLEEALRRDPNLGAGALNLGIVYLLGDRPDLAGEWLERARELLRPSMIHQAEEELARVLEPQRWLRLGDKLLAGGGAAEAKRAYRQAAELGAGRLEAGVGESAALIQLGDPEAAETLLHQLERLQPGDPRVANNLGVIARERGDLEQAAEYFAKATKLSPEWELAEQNLVELEAESRDVR